MGKREPKHLFEDNPFLDGFAEWMGSAEGQLSGEALDVIWVLLETAHVDANKRKIIWEDGQRLSITESVQRIHADHPDFPPELIEEHLIGWLQMEYAPPDYSEKQLDELARMLHKQCDLNRLAWCGIEIATIQNDERSLPYPLSLRAAAG